jgi:hypothetical protein
MHADAEPHVVGPLVTHAPASPTQQSPGMQPPPSHAAVHAPEMQRGVSTPHAWQAPPLAPQAEPASPGSHWPIEPQQPPLHSIVTEQVVLQIPDLVSQASPGGQSSRVTQ